MGQKEERRKSKPLMEYKINPSKLPTGETVVKWKKRRERRRRREKEEEGEGEKRKKEEEELAETEMGSDSSYSFSSILFKIKDLRINSQDSSCSAFPLRRVSLLRPDKALVTLLFV